MTYIGRLIRGREGTEQLSGVIRIGQVSGAVASNGGIMGNSAALAMSLVRPVAGAGSAVLGCTTFAVGALVSPLVGLGGEDSALVPALVMAGACTLSFTLSRRSGAEEAQPRASSSAIATS